jgi:hypothetical protein
MTLSVYSHSSIFCHGMHRDNFTPYLLIVSGSARVIVEWWAVLHISVVVYFSLSPETRNHYWFYWGHHASDAIGSLKIIQWYPLSTTYFSMFMSILLCDTPWTMQSKESSVKWLKNHSITVCLYSVNMLNIICNFEDWTRCYNKIYSLVYLSGIFEDIL